MSQELNNGTISLIEDLFWILGMSCLQTALVLLNYLSNLYLISNEAKFPKINYKGQNKY